MVDRLYRFFGSPVLVSVVVAFAVAAAIIAATGVSPLLAFGEMFNGVTDGFGVRGLLARMIPIVGLALAVSISFRAGIINLGAEGSLVMGGLAGTLVAIYLPGPGIVVIPLAMLAGAVVGMAWGMIPAVLQNTLQLPVLISSLLLNYPARAITSYLVRFPFADPTVTSASTVEVPATARIPDLPGEVSVTLIGVLIAVAAVWVFNTRTVGGYETEIAGLNGRFARYGGVSTARQMVWTMGATGAIAGVIGSHLIVGDVGRFLDGDLVRTGFAWSGLLVALLARFQPWGILVAGTFFAALQVGGSAMQRNANVSEQISQVIQAIVIVALASRIGFKRRKSSEPTAADTDAAPVGEV
jgi:general nucleoside transport system permease protein